VRSSQCEILNLEEDFRGQNIFPDTDIICDETNAPKFISVFGLERANESAGSCLRGPRPTPLRIGFSFQIVSINVFANACSLLPRTLQPL
jgi:hypothetical protein